MNLNKRFTARTKLAGGLAVLLVLPPPTVGADQKPSPPSAAAGVAIDHDPISCVVAEKFTKVESRFDPTDKVARARVYFRAEGKPLWYFVDLMRDAGTFRGVLPKVKKSVKRIDYYVDAINPAMGESRTEEYFPDVVTDKEQCKKRAAALFLSEARVLVGSREGAPLVPEGFEAEGVVAASPPGPPGTVSASAAPPSEKKKNPYQLPAIAMVGGGAALAIYGFTHKSSPSGGLASCSPSYTNCGGASTGLGITGVVIAAGGAVLWHYGDKKKSQTQVTLLPGGGVGLAQTLRF